jgi:hypothetical protein
MAPRTDPDSRNGVPPLKIRSPQNTTERSGIHTTMSLVVCAGPPAYSSSHRRSSAHNVTLSAKVRNGRASSRSP